MNSHRIAVFLAIVLTVWTAMHVYVWARLMSVPWISTHLGRRSLLSIAIVLWSTYLIARFLDACDLQFLAAPLEFVGACWIGVLFLMFSAFLVVDVFTVGGFVFSSWVPAVRSWAVIAAVALSVFGLFQAQRAPSVREEIVELRGLPAERNGLVLVEISDLHLGTLLSRRWLEERVKQVESLRPDLLVIVGDLVDGNARRVEPLQPVLQKLHAPLGVWLVTGNHEYYAGLDRCLKVFEDSGFSVLRDRWAQPAPGLVLAGVDDLTARRQLGDVDHPVQKALADRPDGAAILLSHSPWQAETAAGCGAGLMLSGHTHAGQIWPFTYIVRLSYPLVAGRYQVSGMPVIVCRGTGTWGPRLRLWRRSEIVRITLKARSAETKL